jgi:hypothetical protein
MCVEKFADANGIGSRDAFNYLYKYKGLEFLDECYEAEHQLSFDDAIADIADICRKNRGDL